jgi:hypothetical protein
MYWRTQGERVVETSRSKSIPRIRRRLFTCGSTLPIFQRVQARSHVTLIRVYTTSLGGNPRKM